MTLLRMNTFLGKKVLSVIRGGDFAHAGEEEAIEVAFCEISRDPRRNVVDIGCGRGGTAKYIKDHGWGNVLGIDIDEDSISYAAHQYPDVSFIVGDAHDLAEIVEIKYDIICMFNSLYACGEKFLAIEQASEVASSEAEIVIFDYVAGAAGTIEREILSGEPPRLDDLEMWLGKLGWKVENVINLDKEYERWYVDLLGKVEDNKKEILELADAETFEGVRKKYATILEEIQKGTVGGASIRAKRPALT